jgi:hypothetical protein
VNNVRAVQFARRHLVRSEPWGAHVRRCASRNSGAASHHGGRRRHLVSNRDHRAPPAGDAQLR